MTRALAVACLAALVGCAHAPPPSQPSPPPPPSADAPSAAATSSPAATGGASPKWKSVPPYVLDTRAIERPLPRLPDEVLRKYSKKGELVGMYKVCVGTDGHVAALDTLQPVPDANERVVATLKEWRYRPLPIPVCSLVRLVYSLVP